MARRALSLRGRPRAGAGPGPDGFVRIMTPHYATARCVSTDFAIPLPVGTLYRYDTFRIEECARTAIGALRRALEVAWPPSADRFRTIGKFFPTPGKGRARGPSIFSRVGMDPRGNDRRRHGNRSQSFTGLRSHQGPPAGHLGHR